MWYFVRSKHDRRAFILLKWRTTRRSLPRRKFSRIIRRSSRRAPRTRSSLLIVARIRTSADVAKERESRAREESFTNVERRAWRCESANKYSMAAGRSENARWRWYVNINATSYEKLLRNAQFFESTVFTFFFFFLTLQPSPPPSPPPVRRCVSMRGGPAGGFGRPGWFHKRWKWRCKSWWL